MNLGPVVQELGSIRRTRIGRATGRASIALGIVGCFFLLIPAVLPFITGLAFTDFLILVAVAVAFLFIGIIPLAFSILMVMQLNRTTATICAHGLVLGQSWFRKAQVPWHAVMRIEPPAGTSGWVRFDLVLRSGTRVCADRLRLKPERDPDGALRNHPDVQAVLSHYAAWQQAQGGAWRR